jgi:hypothetical protein
MELTPELIEKMRAIGLRLDKAGTFWQEGSPVTHLRLRQALLRWLDVLDDGRNIIRLDEKRFAYVDIEDAHLRALSARWDGDRFFILWDDDQETELDYGALSMSEDNAFYTKVRGKLRGRIAGAAHHALVERVVEQGDSFVLDAASKQWPIANAA